MPEEAPAPPCAEAPEPEGRWLAVGGTVLAVGPGALRPPCDPNDGPASAGAVVTGDTAGEPSCDPRDPAYAIPASARAAATAIESVLRGRGRRSGTTGAGASILAMRVAHPASTEGTATAAAAPVRRSWTAMRAAAAAPCTARSCSRYSSSRSQAPPS